MEMTADLRDLLGQVFDQAQSGLRSELAEQGRAEDYDRIRHDFVFHMTDWLDDLTKYHAMAEAPEVWKIDRATTFVIGFLYHVVPHLNAAGRLLLDEIADTFAGDESDRVMQQLRPPRRPARR
jgi:hypothetical protein